MDISNTETITITYYQGGRKHHQDTGEYQRLLKIDSANLSHSWQINLNKDGYDGTLKKEGREVYKYSFDGVSCKLYDMNGTAMKTVFKRILVD
jgi:hypothetical protein